MTASEARKPSYLSARQRLALIAGKLVGAAARLTGSGGGALPGLVVDVLSPGILASLARCCSMGVIVISGTNGKTTTSRMVAAILVENGIRTIHNRTGSNLTRGHLSAFAGAADWTGRINADCALLETDEAYVPQLLEAFVPRILLLHNLFRDQLDRHGEVDMVVAKWSKALNRMPVKPVMTLVNADDPNLAYLAEQSGIPYKAYGIDDVSLHDPVASTISDAYFSPASHLPLSYQAYFLAHLGLYSDPEGAFRRPKRTVSARSVSKDKDGLGQILTVDFGEQMTEMTLKLPGISTVYNALAAFLVAEELGLPTKLSVKALQEFKTAFGRMERLKAGDHELVVCLVKNPAAAGEAFRIIAEDGSDADIAFIANDDFADGRDVSWYFDIPVRLDELAKKQFFVSGSRSLDLAVWMKYAGVSSQPIAQLDDWISSREIEKPGGRSYLLCTYTALLELQKFLERLNLKAPYYVE